MSSCFSRCLRVPIAIRAFYESYLWILQTLLLTHPDLHPGLLVPFQGVTPSDYESPSQPASLKAAEVEELEKTVRVVDRSSTVTLWRPSDERTLVRWMQKSSIWLACRKASACLRVVFPPRVSADRTMEEYFSCVFYRLSRYRRIGRRPGIWPQEEGLSTAGEKSLPHAICE
jgi:hypothetical protein